MGPYCRYCDKRCFVSRVLPEDARGQYAGKSLIMATCPGGKQHDREVSGYDADTATNPVEELGGTTRRALPPGITRCGAATDSGWGCFRPAGHDGRHDPDGYPDGAR